MTHPLIRWKEIATFPLHSMDANFAIFAAWMSRKNCMYCPRHTIGLLPWLPRPPLGFHANIWERHIFLDRTLDFGFIIFTILSPTPRNKDAAESALPTVAPFLAATRSASAFARWLVTGLMVGRDGAAPSWIVNKPTCSHGMALLRNGTLSPATSGLRFAQVSLFQPL